MLPIFSQSAQKILEFVGRALTKFTKFTASSSTDFNPSGMLFEAGAYLWKLQCAQEMFGATISVRATNPA
jgi:hypothetical protein